MSQKTLGTVWPLFLGMGVLMLGAGLQGTLLSFRATLEGFPTTVIGLIMSSYYIGYLFGTSVAPRLLRRVGHVRVFAAFAAVASVAILVQAVFVRPGPWAGMRLASGLCFAGIYVVVESWLNDSASRANRGRFLAVYMLVLYVGLGLGQYLLNLSDPRTTVPFILVAALISVAMVPIVLSTRPAPQLVELRTVRYRDLYRSSPLGLVAVAFSGTISSVIFAIGPVYAGLTGFSTAGVAQFMAVSILAGVVTQYPVGRLSDRLDRRTVLAGACVIATAAAAAIAVFSPLPHLELFSLTAVFSGASLTLYSLAVSHVNDQLEPDEMVAASSAILRLNGLAAAAGPTLAGVLIDVFGTRAYFATLGGLTGLLAVYDFWRKRQRRPTPVEQKGPFISARTHGVGAQIIAAGVGPEPEPDADRDTDSDPEENTAASSKRKA